VWGGRTDHALTRVRHWYQHRPAPILGALPQQQWRRPVPPRGQDRLATRWRPVEDPSPATRSRWPGTGVGDDRVVKKAGPPRALVGAGSSGPAQRVRLGIEGWRRMVVIGAGTLGIPVDCTGRRPNPVGPGRPCRDQLRWLPVLGERTWTAWPRRGLGLPPPLIVAARWCGDAPWRAHVARQPRGTAVVEGQQTAVCRRSDGRRGTGQERLTRPDGAWRDRLQRPGRRDARRTATSPTSGTVPVVIGKAPGAACSDRRCQATPRTAPRLIRAWKRRSWSADAFRTLQQWWATDAWQVHGEDADDGHLVWRLWAGLVRLDTARRRLNGRVTLEAIVFSLTPHGRFRHSTDLE